MKKPISPVVALDIGGTKIAAAMLLGTRILKQVTIPTESKKGKQVIVSNIIAATKQIFTTKACGIGVSAAGQINQKKGVIISSPNFSKQFKNVELKKILQQTFKVPAALDNDANCFTLGEAVYGSAKNHSYVVGLTLGTGVGGGIVINKQVYRGTGGTGGELGHIIVTPNERPCSCGQKNHLEGHASGTAIADMYYRICGKKVDSYAVAALAKQGDKNAKKALNVATLALSDAFVSLTNALNPDIIVIGGGLSSERLLLDKAIKLSKNRFLYPSLGSVIITKAKNNEAALLGAAALL